jgi:hypothetical protein
MGRSRKHEIDDIFGVKDLYDHEEVAKHYLIFDAMCKRRQRIECEDREAREKNLKEQKIITLPQKKRKIITLPSKLAQKNLKHILCNNVANGGACSHSADCWYAHSEEEMTSITCTFGLRCENSNCRYTHPEGHVIKPKVNQKPCFFIQPDGTCKFGDKCKYSHEPPSESLIITFDSSFDELEEGDEEDEMSDQLQELYITNES